MKRKSFLSMTYLNEIIKPVNNKGGLYLGSYFSAETVKVLEEKNIKAVLSVCIECKINYKNKN